MINPDLADVLTGLLVMFLSCVGLCYVFREKD